MAAAQSSIDRNEAELARLARAADEARRVFANTQQSNQAGGR